MVVVTPRLSRRNGGRIRIVIVGGGGRGDMNLYAVSSLRYIATDMVGVVIAAAAAAAIIVAVTTATSASAVMTSRTTSGG